MLDEGFTDGTTVKEVKHVIQQDARFGQGKASSRHP